MTDAFPSSTAGTPERLGGSPRTNEADAYATFMDMADDEFRLVVGSVMGGGMLEPAETKGLMRAIVDRKKP